ncbi:hypothetical protein RQM65_03410 [Pricia sp. S334]|uniref:Lipoprotein n=1 Tax=Pricia mediterranea TaxID=3076079 RepID=A0ABU3L2T7_9FLAO|nr:hypothetical protein [Pricia sp. S334]MDT7827713.1 hypothetical protein [Pricia sp. S334]
MKNAQKLTYKLLTGFLLLVGLLGCGEIKDRVDDDKAVTVEEVEDMIISDAQAKTRYDNYGQHRGRIIEIYENNGREIGNSTNQKAQNNRSENQNQQADNQGSDKSFVPVQYTHYDFEKFKKYLQFVEQETKKAGADISELRIYFANYPENEGDRDKQKRNTVMFVPTINVDGKESAYYIDVDDKDGRMTPFLLTDSLQRTDKAAPKEMLKRANNTQEANLLPNFILRPVTAPFYAEQSVIGNEWHRNPPASQ